MTEAAFALFDTPIGRCAIVWRGAFIIGAALPETSDALAHASLKRRFPDVVEAEPSPVAAQAIAAVCRLLNGEAEDFASVPLDLSAVPDFDRRVLDAAFRIPVGETRTYGEIAAGLDSPGAARAVGRALGANPIPIIVPCHRVLAADGRIGGFSAPGGPATKMRMLDIERARRGSEPQLFAHLPWDMAPKQA